MDSCSVPLDLSMEILSRLPAKSVARFHCVSKQWASIFDRPDFKDLFLTKSSPKPHLLFALVEDLEDDVKDDEWSSWCFFLLPQRQIPYEKKSTSTLVVTPEFHLEFPPENMQVYHYSHTEYFSIGNASGLLYFNGASCGGEYELRPLVCNPNTGRYAMLPDLKRYRKTYSFFLFEPIDKQYKVLFMAYPFGPDRNHKIYTLGSGDLGWRTVKCSLRRHEVKCQGICINGVLYYLGDTSNCHKDGHEETPDYVIVCFDIRSEKFTFIEIEGLCGLINFIGKLAVVYWEDGVDNYSEDDDVDDASVNELRLWILEDVEKQEWSKYAYTLSNEKFSRRHVSVVGVTTLGEIVFSMRKYTSNEPFYVFYFNPESKNLRCVEIQGFGEVSKSVYTFVDHVENLNANDPKLLESFHTPYVEAEEFDSFSDYE